MGGALTIRRLGPFLLLLPALALVVLLLLIPLVFNLSMAVRDPAMRAALPQTARLLRGWNGTSLPPEAVFAATARELKQAEAAQELGPLVQRLNFERTGLRSLVLRTARADLAPPYRDSMAALDRRWADPDLWRILRRASGRATALNLLRSVDLDLTPTGEVVRVEAEQAVFLPLFARSFAIALAVTGLCVLIGYPVAYTITTLSPFWSRVAIIAVLVPFWISMLVRTTAWFILLQREGPINAALVALQLVDHPVQLIFTRLAVYVAMVHVLLPFAILPLVGVMRRIDPALLRAAASLGAPGPMRFLRVYLPLTLPGVG
ncbi:MAG TPA: ABC transporter permease, partial [Acetobacteraceae bacterium]